MGKNEDRAPTKVYFSEDELRLVKLAAIVRGLTASEFARESTLRAAAQEMKDFRPPALPKERPPKRKRRTDKRIQR